MTDAKLLEKQKDTIREIIEENPDLKATLNPLEKRVVEAVTG